MNIEFSTNTLKKICSTEGAMRKKWDEKMAKKLMTRLQDLEAAETLEVMRPLPGHCHELRGNHKGKLSMYLVGPERLIFEPDHDPVPTKPDGGLDWKQVTSIIVTDVGDYH